jgi:hypothetical protein
MEVGMAAHDLTCDARESESPYVATVWHSVNEHLSPFISMAQSQWGMVISRCQGKSSLTIRGPETRATPAWSPPDAEFIGILFKPGTLMPLFPARDLMDRCDVTLPESTRQSFELNGERWQFPDYENVETFIEWLVGEGLLVHDPLVADALNGLPVDSSLRTVQRRFLQATGLTHSTIDQIRRARFATRLLKQGTSILDTVDLAGYADQPHLTRSLKRFIGLTPNQISSENRQEALSFLFEMQSS